MMLVALAMLPVFGLTLYHASVERDRKLHELEGEAVRMAELSAGGIGKVIEGTRQTLLFLAHAEPVRAMNAPASRVLFAELLAQTKSCFLLGLAGSDGRVVASAVPTDHTVYIKDMPWFWRLQQTRGFSIGEYQIATISGKPTLHLAFPLPNQPEGQPMAAVFAGLNLQTLQDCIELPQLPPHGVMLAVDRNGKYLARNPNPEKWVGAKSNSWAALQSKGAGVDGFVETTGVDGIARLYHFEAVPGSDKSIFVAVGISKLTVHSESRAEFLHNLLWLCLFTMAALLCAGVTADRSVLRHVHRLTEAAGRLAKGDWNVHAGLAGGAAEFQQLGQSFDDMATALKQHHDHLGSLVKQRTAELTLTNDALSREIEKRRQREEELRKANRALKALRDSNQAMTRATDEPEYLKEVCKILAEDCGYTMVWIGFAEQDAEKTIRPVAYSGFEEGYLETLKISWADTEYGRGPAGTGIRTGKPYQCRNMLTDPSFAPWRGEAIKRGYASTITLPLMGGGRAFGAIAVYNKEPDAFTDEETKLLTELADDVAYGIAAIKFRTAHAEAEEAEKMRTDLMLRTQKSLLDVSKLTNENFETFISQVIKIDAATLNVERVSIWSMSEDGSGMVCTNAYDRQNGMHSSTTRLLREDYPCYFAALEGGMAIDAHDACKDERTREFATGYLDTLGITSMLDVPIRRNGRIAGILCHEHIGEPRVWTPHDRDFAVSIADFVTIAQEASERRAAEEEQKRLIQELQDALADIKTLSGLLPICSGCKKIRDDDGYWNQIESYICQHSEAKFSHGFCPECLKKYFPEFAEQLIDEASSRSGNSTSDT